MQFGYRSQAEYTAGLNLFDGLKINWKYAIKNTYNILCYIINICNLLFNKKLQKNKYRYKIGVTILNNCTNADSLVCGNA